MQARPGADAMARAILDTDLRATDTLLQLLREERTALQGRDSAAIQAVAERKLGCLRELESNDLRRRQLLRAQRCRDFHDLVTRVDAAGTAGMARDWDELRARLREIAELVEINARIVARARFSTERLLALLRGQTDPVGVYDRSGRARGYSDNRPVIQA